MTMIHLVAAAALLLQSAAGTAKPARKGAPQPPAKAAAAKPAATDLAVTLTYKGKGTVDANHKLVAWIFNDPNITSNSRPIATQSTDKNGDTVTFKNAPATPVYVFAVYDEKGGYDGLSAAPEHGLPCAFYTKAPKGAPAPVKAGDPVVKLTFADAERWNK